MDYHFESIHYCLIIESNVLHQFESHLERLFAQIVSVHWLKIVEIEISILCFRRHPQQVCLRPLDCDAEYFDSADHKSLASKCTVYGGIFLPSLVR